MKYMEGQGTGSGVGAGTGAGTGFRRGELHSPFWAGAGAGAGAGGRPAGPVVHSEPRHEAGAFGAAEALGSRASPANIAPS